MFKSCIFILAAAFICASPVLHNPDNFVSKEGVVSFVSKANFEKITAKSTKLSGTLDIRKHKFSFTIPICSFEGFVNNLQKKHYCEKYVEGEKYPSASFKGKIIDDADLSVAGTYNIRAKGILTLHGVEKETIISATVIVKDGLISIDTKFVIQLADYNMLLSKVNTLVIAKNVDVETKINMIPG